MNWPIRKGLAVVCALQILIIPIIISLGTTAYDGEIPPYTEIVFFEVNETTLPPKFNISLTPNNLTVLPNTIGINNEIACTIPTTTVQLNTTILEWKNTLMTVITPVYSPSSLLSKPNIMVTYTISVDKNKKELLLILFAENVGDAVAKNVRINLNLPRELKLSSLEGGAEFSNSTAINWIGNLSPKQGHSIKLSFKYSGKANEDLKLPLTLGYQDEYGNEWWFQLLIIIAKYLLELLLSKVPGFETVTAVFVILVTIAIFGIKQKKMHSKIR